MVTSAAPAKNQRSVSAVAPSQAGSVCYAAPLPSQSAPSPAGLTAYGSPQSSVSQQQPSGEAGVAGSTAPAAHFFVTDPLHGCSAAAPAYWTAAARI